MALIDDILPGPVALDTAIFIYFIEEHSRYLEALIPLFDAIDNGRLESVTSALTLLETLVIPFRSKNPTLAEHYETILTQSRGLRLIELTLPVLRIAAQIRGSTRIKTPDAIQLAAAITSNCTCFLTNDRDFIEMGQIKIIQLDNYIDTA
ncbi:MAG: type II toxin-antitoxin system VapC family toxin [Thiohalomonadales bacterium]